MKKLVLLSLACLTGLSVPAASQAEEVCQWQGITYQGIAANLNVTASDCAVASPLSLVGAFGGTRVTESTIGEVAAGFVAGTFFDLAGRTVCVDAGFGVGSTGVIVAGLGHRTWECRTL